MIARGDGRGEVHGGNACLFLRRHFRVSGGRGDSGAGAGDEHAQPDAGHNAQTRFGCQLHSPLHPQADPLSELRAMADDGPHFLSSVFRKGGRGLGEVPAGALYQQELLRERRGDQETVGGGASPRGLPPFVAQSCFGVHFLHSAGADSRRVYSFALRVPVCGSHGERDCEGCEECGAAALPFAVVLGECV